MWKELVPSQFTYAYFFQFLKFKLLECINKFPLHLHVPTTQIMFSSDSINIRRLFTEYDFILVVLPFIGLAKIMQPALNWKFNYLFIIIKMQSKLDL